MMRASPLQPGGTIDGFLIGERVHAGGMATLWSVSRPGDDMPMLMKVPKLADGEDPATIVGFEMEQMIMPRLTGPHVPAFIAAGSFEVQPYIVMERVPGPSLIKRLGDLPLALGEVAALGAKIAHALDDLHRQHVIHLDVKPSNILFRPNGDAVLIDYGLSRHDQLPDLMEAEFRVPFGTAPYMAPEQVMGNRHDARSDLFALGVLMYFFATGARPFGDPQRMSGLKRRIWLDPVPPRKRRPEIPPWLQEIILRCLEVNPAWRHPSAAQLAFDLANPTEVVLTARAERQERDSFATVLRRRFNPETMAPILKATVSSRLDDAPIVCAALDLGEGDARLAQAIRSTVQHVLKTMPDARVACVSVLKQNLVKLDTTLDEAGRHRHVDRLVALKHWAIPLGIDDSRLSFHVLEAVSPAAAILEYVGANRVDHVVMGARAKSMAKSILGSVSGEVAAKAPCTVTIVRSRRWQADGASGTAGG